MTIAAATAGCGAGDVAPVALAARHDSAGIEIVENASPAWRPGEAWRLADAPLLEIGAVHGDPDYEFGSAHGAVRLADGRIVVADMQTNYMSFFDSTGTFLMRAGGTGQGPGEFSQLYRLRRIDGDSLMALNPTSLTSIFTAAGEYVRRFSLDPVPGRSNLWWLGRLSGGTLVAMSLQREGTRELSPPANPQPGREYPLFDVPDRDEFYRDTLLYMLFDMEGALIDSIARLPGQYIAQNRTYAPNAAHAVFGDAFFHSPGDRVEIRTYRSLVEDPATSAAQAEAPVMRLERIVRRQPIDDLTMTEARMNVWRDNERARYERLRASSPDGITDQFLERMLAEMRFPPTIPAHANRMFADAAGNLWLQEYRMPGDDDQPFTWSVFDTDGQWLGTVETPAGFTVNEIGDDYVLGVARDSLDVQFVRLYRLEKPRG